jgi:hypothetical protein
LTALFLATTLSGTAGSPGRRALLALYSNISAHAEGISFTASETDGAAMSWEGPHRISDYLGNVANSPSKRPPEGPGVYIVSENPWRDMPTHNDNILYVGQVLGMYLRGLCRNQAARNDDHWPPPSSDLRCASAGSGTRAKLPRLGTDNTEFHGPASIMTFDRGL